MTGHFLKTVVIFTLMIILGLAGVVLLKYLDKSDAGDKYKLWDSVGVLQSNEVVLG